MTEEDVMSERVIEKTYEDDPEVREAAGRREALLRERDVARAACWRLLPEGKHGPTPTTLEYLRLYDAAMVLDDAVAVSDREVQAAERAAQARIVESRRPGRDGLLRDLMGAAEKVISADRVLRTYDEATGSAAGLAPGAPPLPAIGLLREQLAQLRAALDRRPGGATPVRPGHTRVRLLSNVWSADRLHCWAAGDVVDLDERDARDAVKREFAVEVAS